MRGGRSLERLHVPTGRVVGVDIARAVAILGMFAVQFGPTDRPGLGGRLYALPLGRASLLFMLVAGVGISLLASSRSGGGDLAVRLLWRALLLLPLGLALQGLDHGANVILQTYAVLFVLAVVLVRLGDRAVLGLAGLSALLGPLVYWWGQSRAPDLFVRDGKALLDAPADIAHSLLLSGPYPLVTWLAPFLVGMWIGRRDLRSSTLRRRMVGIGAVTAVAAFTTSRMALASLGGPVTEQDPGYLLMSAAHSQMWLWLIGGMGAATCVFGVSLLVADAAPRASWPLAAAGQLALTLYVAHLLALHAGSGWLVADDVPGALVVLVLGSVVAVVAAWAWRRRFRSGPLEFFLHVPWRLAQRQAGRGPDDNGHHPGASPSTVCQRHATAGVHGLDRA